ncbi:MAG: hypothetical protein WBD47_04730 [Phormidesmis sp.]
MNQTVLPQLQTIETELASQESQLTAQLTAVREKLTGIRTVMPMFRGAADLKEEAPAIEEPTIEKPAVSEASAPVAPKKTTPKKAAQKKAIARQKTTPRKASAKKKDGRTAAWQKYTRPGVKNESIPDAVRLILETQPSKEFKIAEVMEALFQEGMPKAQYLKARNRISNVLSGGVRAGDWHRGARSTYRLTAA